MNANGRRIANLASIIAVTIAWSAGAAEASHVTAVVVAESLVGQAEGKSTNQPLSVRAVEQLLAQARQQIESENFDQAHRLLTIAESSNVRYPLLYFGLKPERVRRELNSARQLAGDNGNSNLSTAPAAPRSNGPRRPQETSEAQRVQGSYVDPFSAAQPANPTAAGVIEPHHQVAAQVYPTAGQPSGGRHASTEQTPTAPADLPGLGRVADNPFKSAENDIHRDAPLPDSIDFSASTIIADPADYEATTPGLYGIEPGQDHTEFAAATAPTNVADDQWGAQTGQPGDGSLDAPLPAQDRFSLGQSENSSDAWIYDKLSAPPETKQLERYSSAAADLTHQESLLQLGATPGDSMLDALPSIRNLEPPINIAATNVLSSDDGQEIRALHVSQTDTTQNANTRAFDPDSVRLAQLPQFNDSGMQPLPNRLPQPGTIGTRPANLLEAGEAALRNGDRNRALQLFKQAEQYGGDMDAASRERLQSHLRMLTVAPAPDTSAPSDPSLLSSTEETTEVLARQLQADITKRQTEAKDIRESNPKRALALLEEIRGQIVESSLPANVSSQLLRRVDLSLSDTEQYIDEHRAEIELEDRNREVLEEIDRRRAVKIKVQEDVAELVDKFNALRDEQRYAEMEIVAQRLYDLAPDEPVVQQVWQNAKFIRRTIINQDLANRREESFWGALNDVEQSSIQEVGDGREIVYTDAERWDRLTKQRGPRGGRNRLSERELEIQRRLRTPVLLRYDNRPLSEVIDGLSQLTGVNIHLDPRGLYQENQTADVPVTINLSKEISLESALNLILEPLHLSYVIKDEVLKITSEQLRDGELYFDTYPVADLVIPIPNFVPTNNIGLQGLLNDAHAALGYGAGGFGVPGPLTLVNAQGRQVDGQTDPNMLAQQFGTNPGPLPAMNVPINGGPGGLGGGANADFDSLIDLIISTVATDTWAENGGGTAEVRAFPTNLSLVISQTQAVHEEIQDLLEQLRRLQDLQVTIEVRFIRLSDDFFERIGLDFDLNIEDRTGIASSVSDPMMNDPQGLFPGSSFEPRRSSALVGIQPPTAINDYPNYTTNLDIELRQNSFELTAPTFGGLTSDMGQFGFAILSDIEATFLINAVQGDTRTNVLNAPKVTLFNGQQAFVADAAQVPFVISVVPVVGEFAAAQQPVIVVLSEGTLMSIQAVVSDDRRYVRLTVVPFFSDIGNVSTFTFEGSSSSTSSSSSTTDDEGDGNNNSESSSSGSTSMVGTTVQLPTFQFVAVVTTVSVPDGGTVLLGGIKRLSEGRNERGIPILSKIPYVDRLFRNVGIGRTTDSLMMMVTPRIIIQEEEEEKLGVTPL